MSDTSVPNHVGLILDGNRRWAKEQGLPALEGHRRGVTVLREVAMHAFDRGVEIASVYVFSQENWERTEEEVGYLMKLVVTVLEQYLGEFHERGIRLLILGRRDGLRKKVLDAINRAEAETKDNTNGTLALCFNYGGREEIADAAQQVADSGQTITPQNITSALYQPALPDLDLVIRTSGEQRLSGFMLWRASYAELHFTPIMWPAFTTADFDTALDDYAARKRRFGS